MHLVNTHAVQDVVRLISLLYMYATVIELWLRILLLITHASDRHLLGSEQWHQIPGQSSNFAMDNRTCDDTGYFLFHVNGWLAEYARSWHVCSVTTVLEMGAGQACPHITWAYLECCSLLLQGKCCCNIIFQDQMTLSGHACPHAYLIKTHASTYTIILCMCDCVPEQQACTVHTVYAPSLLYVLQWQKLAIRITVVLLNDSLGALSLLYSTAPVLYVQFIRSVFKFMRAADNAWSDTSCWAGGASPAQLMVISHYFELHNYSRTIKFNPTKCDHRY